MRESFDFGLQRVLDGIELYVSGVRADLGGGPARTRTR